MTSNQTNISKETNLITKKELRQVFWRSCTYNSSYNYERQLSVGWVYSLAPVLRKLYGNDKEKMSEALKRHLVFNNITPFISTLLYGITAALEEEYAKDPTFDPEIINQTKVSLMGPLSAVGDSIFFSTIRVIASSVGASLAAESGSLVGAIVFLLIFNIPNLISRRVLGPIGYNFGTSFINKAQSSGMMNKVFTVTTILGLMVIGGMVASSVSVPLAITFSNTSLLDVINGIMPSLLNLLVFGLVLYLLNKGAKVTLILWGIIIVGIAGAFVGIF
ncbi:PTS system mannose/fructose/sorbose family transporter subunit IID [Traorella massiliensis]|uniref:PTS system mannose/fructose/sorbose family transporter subunit IID n=1 Tax=Traorella massiliensis TaxID=1903263 RepID=UPI002353171D|nr:PTS system mannose/fructose/sorbose family transporter subunit IID [Traorella massiliensis]